MVGGEAVHVGDVLVGRAGQRPADDAPRRGVGMEAEPDVADVGRVTGVHVQPDRLPRQRVVPDVQLGDGGHRRRTLRRQGAELPGEEGHHVGQLVGLLQQRLADPVAGAALLAQQDRVLVADTWWRSAAAAAILRAWSASTRESPSAAVKSTAG